MLNETNYLSVNQLAVFHILCETHGILQHNTVPSVKNILVRQETSTYQTRSETEGKLMTPLVQKKSLISFPDKAALVWNTIPGDLRQVTNKRSFSNSAKTWVKDNIPI